MRCEKCGLEMAPEDSFQHSGNSLCEDCYLQVMATPKTCDPWAVYGAKKTMSQGQVNNLTSMQARILELIKNEGPLEAEQICSRLAIDENEFRSNFAVLRHMELARGCKLGDRVCYTLFNA